MKGGMVEGRGVNEEVVEGEMDEWRDGGQRDG